MLFGPERAAEARLAAFEGRSCVFPRSASTRVAGGGSSRLTMYKFAGAEAANSQAVCLARPR